MRSSFIFDSVQIEFQECPDGVSVTAFGSTKASKVYAAILKGYFHQVIEFVQDVWVFVCDLLSEPFVVLFTNEIALFVVVSVFHSKGIT